MPTPEHPVAIVERIVHNVYLSCVSGPNSDCKQHFCSPAAPCRVARELLAPFLNSSSWNTAVKTYKLDAFFSNVEEGVYYPHPWHINTRVRKAVLLSRYRVSRTICSAGGDRGVYVAYDFGGTQGCAGASEVVIKAWASGSDVEYHREVAAYKILDGCPGVPHTLGSPQYEPTCDVYVLPMQKLGPTLADLVSLLPDKRFDMPMVLTVAIQMIERYRDIHARGLIHSATKPGNICLAPRGAGPPGMLYAIDFGFAIPLADHSPLPSAHRIDAVGNRRFMSVLAHHGISKSQRDDLESLAYTLADLFHGELPWDTPRVARLRSLRSSTEEERTPYAPADLVRGELPWDASRVARLRSLREQQEQHRPQVWRLKMATPASKLFCGMDECFHEFWRDIKALAYGEIPDYDKMRGRFVACLEDHEKACAPLSWWDLWDQHNG